MVRYTVDEEARRRLLDAQRAEALAMKAWSAASRRRERVQVAVDSADAAIEQALLALVETSGLDRAALLTGAPATEVRRAARRASGG